MKRNKAAAAIASFAIVVAAFACTASNEPSEKPPLYGGTPAPGGGVCCPLESPCSPGYRGGWVATAQECGYSRTVIDGAYDKEKDEHGCDRWVSRADAGNAPILCASSPKDASSDADADGGG